jgi:hypothetical protein
MQWERAFSFGMFITFKLPTIEGSTAAVASLKVHLGDHVPLIRLGVVSFTGLLSPSAVITT